MNKKVDFKGDLEMWQSVEKKFAEYLEQTEELLKPIEIAEGKFPYRDIRITTPSWVKTYEVKGDRRAPETWNFVIEYKSASWKPSWICISTADYRVYNVMWERWIADRPTLIMKLFEMVKPKTKWWDWNKTSMRKISCEKLPHLFTKINTDGQRGKETAEGTGKAG